MAATLESLTSDIADIKKALDKPDLSRVKTDEEGRVTSYFDYDDAEPVSASLDQREAYEAPRRRGSYRKSMYKRLHRHGYKPSGVFKSLGHFAQQIIACGNDSSRRETIVGDSLAKSFGLKAGEIAKTIAGMSEQVGTDGGALVIPEYSTQIFDRTYDNDIFGMTDNYTVGGSTMKFLANAETSRANGSRHGGLRGYLVSEGGTITSSKPTYRPLELSLKKLAVLVYLTSELMEDAAALEAHIVKKVSEEFNFLIADLIFNGPGAGAPLGILNSPALIGISAEAGQGQDTLLYENINKMWARCYAPSRANAIWFHNQDVEPQLDTMSLGVGTGGGPVYLPQGGVSVAQYQTLKGRPRQATEFNPTLGDLGDILLADMGQYVTISKGGIAQAVSMHVEFLTDQTALRFTMRVDGQPWENAPITPFKGSNTQSSFLAVAAR